MSSNPFEHRLQEIRKQSMPMTQAQEPLLQQESIAQTKPNPFQKRLEEGKAERYKRESEMIWDQGEDLERETERGTAQATSRVLESALGTPGNIQSLVKGITGLQLGTQLPTSSDIKEFSEKATKGYTKPKSEFEEKGGEILSDITAMALPGGTSYSALRNIGIPVAGFLAKEGLEKAGVGETGSNAAKIALMMGLDLASAYRSKGHGGAKNYAKELWKEGESNIPKGVSITATELETGLNQLKDKIKKGGSSPSDAKALEKIEEISSKVKNGKIPVDELVAFRKKINELIETQGGFDFSTPARVRQQSINNLNQVKDKVIGTLDEYGKINPKFGVPYKQANEAYSVYHASNAASKFLKKHFGDYLKSPILNSLFGFGAKAALGTAGAVGGVIPYQGYKLLYRIYKSPTLAKLYGNVLKGALENNVAETAKNLDQLKKGMQKEKVTQEASQLPKKK